MALLLRVATAFALIVGLASAVGVNPATLPAGQAIKCDASSTAIFRLVNANVYRHYPNPEIAASWDSNWGSFVVADCSGLTAGEALKLNPASLPIGQAIKCDASSGTVFRLMNSNVYRGYPSPTIASSWDANWGKFVVAECSVLTVGDPLKLNPASLPVGQAIKCDASSGTVFRLMNANVYRGYPSPTIASSWDANWGSFVVADCSVLTVGDALKLNPASLPAGQAIKCDSASPAVFRLMNANVYRLYPNPTIASSWDPNWSSFVVAECSGMTRGEDMAIKTL